MTDEALDLLEKLIALVNPLRKDMPVKLEFQAIAARAAKLREGTKCGALNELHHWRCQLNKGHKDAHQAVYSWIDAKDFHS